MKSWQSKINGLIFLLLLVAAGCNERSYSDYYDKPLSEWESYLSAISDHQQIELKNAVLFVRECSPALAELSWWNSFTKDQKSIAVKLIIIEKYATTAKVLLEKENIFIPSYRDSAAVILEKDLLPSTPMKVYFDQRGEIKNIKPIGAHSNQMEFIN